MSCSLPSCWKACVTGGVRQDPRTGFSLAALPVHTAAKTPSSRHAKRRSGAAAFPNRSHRILSATPSPSICWNPVPTCAPSNCCWVIAAWRPPPGIYESPPRRCALPPVPSIYFRGQSLPSRSSLHPSTSERQRRWIARSSKWRMCSTATVPTIVSGMPLPCPSRNAD